MPTPHTSSPSFSLLSVVYLGPPGVFLAAGSPTRIRLPDEISWTHRTESLQHLLCNYTGATGKCAPRSACPGDWQQGCNSFFPAPLNIFWIPLSSPCSPALQLALLLVSSGKIMPCASSNSSLFACEPDNTRVLPYSAFSSTSSCSKIISPSHHGLFPRLFNLFLCDGSFPSACKHAQVLPT